MPATPLRALPPVLLLVLSGASMAVAPALAQMVNKYVYPDGRVVYSDQPVPGAKRAGSLELPPAPSAGQVEAARKRAADEKRTREDLLRRLESRRKELDAAEQRVSGARKSLAEAESAQERGREPLPGEMLGVAGGGVRPSEAYANRQAELQRNVETARKELDDALRAWNAVR